VWITFAWGQVLFFAFIHTNAIFTNAYIAYDPAFFISGKRSMAESYTEDRKYLYRFHPCNDIFKRLYEVFEKSKKQDLTPWFGEPIYQIPTIY
jgi:hypothetical protein